ncbi:MAG TPA: hypothetical protein VF591_13865 [Pyrinomonadaceae bacterium]|jgi:hypothetical protein
MIDWSNAIVAGVAGGLAMELSAVLVGLSGFGRHSMVSYEGCMLTGRVSGVGSYLAGMLMHLALSVLIAFAYAWSFETFWGGGGWSKGLLIAVPHWLAGGLIVPLFDRLSGCVARGATQPLGPFASNSRNAFFTFLIGHLAYGITVGVVYG